MIMIVIMVIGFISILVGTLSSSALASARQEKSSAALTQAKEALLGGAVSDIINPTNIMPGSLPCPDTNDDGDAEPIASGVCPSYIGRLPWRTLKLPDLRDGSGERLWYALSANFRNHSAARPLNSNTKGTLLVYGTDGVSMQTQAGYSAVAVIFAPGNALSTGSPLYTQMRNTVAQKNDAANYLDSIVIPGPITRNNASAGGPFIAGAKSDTFNDQPLFITTKELMPLVEQRVATEVKQALINYYAANNYYPWADNVSASTDYDANDGYNRGWLPNNIATTSSAAEWSGTARPPQWFFYNQWYTLIYYSFAKHKKPPGACNPPFCTANTLSVNGTSGVGALFFMPGTPVGALIRTPTDLTHYLEDSENYGDNDDVYITPTSHAQDRDRLYLLP